MNAIASDPFLALLLSPSASAPVAPATYPPELTTKDWLQILWPRRHSPPASSLPADAGVVYGADKEDVF